MISKFPESCWNYLRDVDHPDFSIFVERAVQVVDVSHFRKNKYDYRDSFACGNGSCGGSSRGGFRRSNRLASHDKGGDSGKGDHRKFTNAGQMINHGRVIVGMVMVRTKIAI